MKHLVQKKNKDNITHLFDRDRQHDTAGRENREDIEKLMSDTSKTMRSHKTQERSVRREPVAINQ